MIGSGSTEVTCLQYCNSEADDSELLKILNKCFLVTSEWVMDKKRCYKIPRLQKVNLTV